MNSMCVCHKHKILHTPLTSQSRQTQYTIFNTKTNKLQNINSQPFKKTVLIFDNWLYIDSKIDKYDT